MDILTVAKLTYAIKNMEPKLSPLTGENCTITHDASRKFFLIVQEDIGVWASYGSYILDNEISAIDGATKAALITQISLIGERTGKPVAILANSREESELDESFLNSYFPIFIDEISRKAKLIFFKEKALRTLQILIGRERSPGEGIQTPIVAEAGYPGMRFSNGNRAKDLSWGYCCQYSELLIVFRFLREEGYIIPADLRIYITPKGYDVASNFKSGDIESVSQLFLICRFLNIDDNKLASRFKPVEDILQVAINRVSDYEHNNKIDDEILLRIQSASLVIVDVDLENFNVGFEAGYAFALNKEIIFTSQTQISKEHPLPFDINTRNVIDHRGDDDEFVKRLSNRIRFCLSKVVTKLATEV